jgi:hypothetical protein
MEAFFMTNYVYLKEVLKVVLCLLSSSVSFWFVS